MTRTFGRKLIFVIVVVAGLLAVNTWLGFNNIRQMRSESMSVSRTRDVLFGLGEIISLAKDAETGQRGYIITGEPTYLDPYKSAMARLDEQIKLLEQVTAHDPTLQGRIPALKNRIADRLRILEEGIILRKENGFDAARQNILMGHGKAEMDELRKQIDEMAHEFNNPLGIVMGFAQDLLTETDPTTSQYRALKIIDEEAKRCQKIIQELLEFSRPKSADLSLTDITQAVEKTLNLVRNHLSKNQIEADTQFGENLPKIHTDPQQLEQVLVNLYLNAIDAMTEGGKLSVKAKVESNGIMPPMVALTVVETGFGIEEIDLSKIFLPFFTAKKTKGLGLGLPICERIIKNHSGKIEVKSQPGKGTTFKIHLPIGKTISEHFSLGVNEENERIKV
jgi:signal transduction histidine kinase